MDFNTDLIETHSDWLEQLLHSPHLQFANLGSLRQQLASEGAYVIWLQLKETPQPLCLKIGKAQRATKGSLHSRLYDHWYSRERPNPNVLAKHLISDNALARSTGLDLTNRAERQRLLKDWCTFQAQPFDVPIAKREVAILECFLTIRLLPRYVGRCGEYPPLPAAGGEYGVALSGRAAHQKQRPRTIG
jgi:hypothetical protein